MSAVVVSLPKTHVPRWPDRCAVCGVVNPRGKVAVTSFFVNTTATLLRSFGPLCWIEMPACSECGRSMRRRVLLLRLLFCVGFAVSLTTVVAVFGWYRDAGERLLWKVAVVALWSPWLMLMFWFPAPLSLSVDDDEILYGFASPEFEQEFKEVNGIVEGVSLDDLIDVDREASDDEPEEPPPIDV